VISPAAGMREVEDDRPAPALAHVNHAALELRDRASQFLVNRAFVLVAGGALRLCPEQQVTSSVRLCVVQARRRARPGLILQGNGVGSTEVTLARRTVETVPGSLTIVMANCGIRNGGSLSRHRRRIR
jgi:hypothetical protein